MFHFFSVILHHSNFSLVQRGNINVQDEIPIGDPFMAIFDDSHFRFSSAFHGLDWQKITRSCNPSLNKGRIDYLLSVAGAFSLNPLLLITTTIVDDRLNIPPTELTDIGFFKAIKQLATDLVRSNVEDGVHPKYGRAVASISKVFQNRDEKVEAFIRVYDDLYTRQGLEFKISPKDHNVQKRELDLNHTLQWPWTEGECWEFSATHGGAVEGLDPTVYIPSSIDMGPSLYMDWFQNYNHLGSRGTVRASHPGIITIHSTCNVEVTNGEYSTYYAHINATDGLRNRDSVDQGDVLGQIELRPDEALCLCDWATKSFSCTTGPHLHWEVRRNNIPISINNLIVNGLQIRAGTFERDASCSDPEHCVFAKSGATGELCATSFQDDDHNVYCPSVRGNEGNMI